MCGRLLRGDGVGRRNHDGCALYLLFVASFGSGLAASGTGRLRLAVLTVMTGTSVLAAIQLVASDDAQAGLAVLLVPMVAIPLAVAVWVGRLVVERQPAGLTPPTPARVASARPYPLRRRTASRP